MKYFEEEEFGRRRLSKSQLAKLTEEQKNWKLLRLFLLLQYFAILEAWCSDFFSNKQSKKWNKDSCEFVGNNVGSYTKASQTK